MCATLKRRTSFRHYWHPLQETTRHDFMVDIFSKEVNITTAFQNVGAGMGTSRHRLGRPDASAATTGVRLAHTNRMRPIALKAIKTESSAVSDVESPPSRRRGHKRKLSGRQPTFVDNALMQVQNARKAKWLISWANFGKF